MMQKERIVAQWQRNNSECEESSVSPSTDTTSASTYVPGNSYLDRRRKETRRRTGKFAKRQRQVAERRIRNAEKLQEKKSVFLKEEEVRYKRYLSEKEKQRELLRERGRLCTCFGEH